MSETPMTDDFMREAEKDGSLPHPYEVAKFARQLERELKRMTEDKAQT